MQTSTPLLQEQFAELLLRFRRRDLSLTAAIEELTRLARRPLLVEDIELQALLSRIDRAHRADVLRTHQAGRWAGAPTGAAIAAHFAIGKRRLRDVRDAYYTLYLGLPPFDVTEPVAATSTREAVDPLRGRGYAGGGQVDGDTSA